MNLTLAVLERLISEMEAKRPPRMEIRLHTGSRDAFVDFWNRLTATVSIPAPLHPDPAWPLTTHGIELRYDDIYPLGIAVVFQEVKAQHSDRTMMVPHIVIDFQKYGQEAVWKLPDDPFPELPKKDILQLKGRGLVEHGGTLYDYTTYGSRNPELPAHVVCDFCLQQVERMWTRRHAGFCMLNPRREYQAGWWCYCVFCKPLVDERDTGTLVARVLTLNPMFDPTDVRAVYDALFDCYYGDVQYWESGRPLPR